MGTLNDSQPVRAAFEREPLMIRLDELHSSRPLPNTAAASRKFLNILASIATVGLVEPLAVARVQGELTPFRVLDGRLRIEALRRLGIEEALSDLSLQLVRLEKELATLQETSRQGDERYGIEHLHLTVAVTYVASVMGNKVVSSWLAEHYPEIAIQFQSMTGEVTPSEPRRAKKLHFKKRPPPSEASA